MAPRGLESNDPSRDVTVWPSSAASHTTESPSAIWTRAGVKRIPPATTSVVAARAGDAPIPIAAATTPTTVQTRRVSPLIGTVLPETGANLTTGPPARPVLLVPSKGD